MKIKFRKPACLKGQKVVRRKRKAVPGAWNRMLSKWFYKNETLTSTN